MPLCPLLLQNSCFLVVLYCFLVHFFPHALCWSLCLNIYFPFLLIRRIQGPMAWLTIILNAVVPFAVLKKTFLLAFFSSCLKSWLSVFLSLAGRDLLFTWSFQFGAFLLKLRKRPPRPKLYTQLGNSPQGFSKWRAKYPLFYANGLSTWAWGWFAPQPTKKGKTRPVRKCRKRVKKIPPNMVHIWGWWGTGVPRYLMISSGLPPYFSSNN